MTVVELKVHKEMDMCFSCIVYT